MRALFLVPALLAAMLIPGAAQSQPSYNGPSYEKSLERRDVDAAWRALAAQRPQIGAPDRFDVRYEREGKRALVVFVEKAEPALTQYGYYSLPSPSRYLVDIEGARVTLLSEETALLLQ